MRPCGPRAAGPAGTPAPAPTASLHPPSLRAVPAWHADFRQLFRIPCSSQKTNYSSKTLNSSCSFFLRLLGSALNRARLGLTVEVARSASAQRKLGATARVEDPPVSTHAKLACHVLFRVFPCGPMRTSYQNWRHILIKNTIFNAKHGNIQLSSSSCAVEGSGRSALRGTSFYEICAPTLFIAAFK